MASQEHLDVAKGGTEAITRWRRARDQEWLSSHGEQWEDLRRRFYDGSSPLGQLYIQLVDLKDAREQFMGFDLQGAHLERAQLDQADLSWSNLEGADLRGAVLSRVKLRNANLARADLSGAILAEADLVQANLTDAKLPRAVLTNAQLGCAKFLNASLTKGILNGSDMFHTDFTGATLTGATLDYARCVGTSFDRADLSGSNVYGTAIWDVSLSAAVQRDLVITNPNDRAGSLVTVDDLEIAQFIHLLVTNKKVRQIIDDVTSKVVLILGRFTEERKAVLDAIRESLRNKNYVPVLFDFDKPDSKDLTGTVETLARLARFIIADLTDPSSIPHELATIVPFLRTTPVLPLRLVGTSGYSMFDDFRAYAWVLGTYEYSDQAALIAALPDVIAPADVMAAALRKRG